MGEILQTVHRRMRAWLGAIRASRRIRRLPGVVLTLAVPASVILLTFVLTGLAGPGETQAAGARAWTSQPEGASPVFSATVHVVPSTTTLRVGERLSVSVAIHVSEGCQFPIYELTLGQDRPIFAYTFPPTATVGPPVSNPFTYTLTAVATGTTTLHALAYGERYCGDYWQWWYLHGESMPVAVWEERQRIYLPHIWRPCQIVAHGVDFWPEPPGPLERRDDLWFGATISYTSDCETVAHVSAFQVYPGETPPDCTERVIPPDRPFWANQADYAPGDHVFHARFIYADLAGSDRLVTRVQVLQRGIAAQQLYCAQQVYLLEP